MVRSLFRIIPLSDLDDPFNKVTRNLPILKRVIYRTTGEAEGTPSKLSNIVDRAEEVEE